MLNAAPLLVRHVAGREKVTPGIKGDDAVTPDDPTEGRPCAAPKSRRKSVPVSTANGRPEATSTMGERVKLPRKCFHNPSADFAEGAWKTALVTQRWRWSKSELPRSTLGKRLSCGSRRVGKSVASAMVWDHV